MKIKITPTGNKSLDGILNKLVETNWKANLLLQAVGGDFGKLSPKLKEMVYKRIYTDQNNHADTSSQDAIDFQRNVMAFGNGNYPLSMSDCYVVGLNGNCGDNCPVFLRGDCPNENKETLKSAED